MGDPVNALLTSTTVHTLTITDNDVSKLTLVGDTSSGEENSPVVFHATLDQPNPRTNIEVSFQVNGSATEETDFSITNSPVVIEAGKISAPITLTIENDEDVEPNETVVVTLTNTSPDEGEVEMIDPLTKTLTILDDDRPRIEWQTASQKVWEDVGEVTITAILDQTSHLNINASYIVNGGDHTLKAGTISITAGQTVFSKTFNILPDPECEANETIKITLTNAQNAKLGSIPVHTVYVQEICPGFVTDGDVKRLEDCGAQTVTSWASGITTGKPDVESKDFLLRLMETDNDNLFSDSPDVSDNGDLTFTPAPDANGSASFEILLKVDDYFVSTNKSFTIGITPVNDCPAFSMPERYTVDEDAPLQTLDNWVSNAFKGPSDESIQTLTFEISNTNSEMFDQEPQLNDNGDLTFQINKNANGESIITVELNDNGGTENDGCNSVEKTFKLVVNPINDPPVNTMKPDITGVLQLDQTLTGRKGEWNDDNDQSPGTISYTYQWEVADNIEGSNVTPIPDETNNTLDVVQSLVGKFIRLSVTASDDGEGKPAIQSVTRKSGYYGPIKALPLLSFKEKGQRVTESSGQIQIPVTLGRSSDVNVTVSYSIEGTASENDYDVSSEHPLNIEAGQTIGRILVDITDDSEDEAEETIIVVLSDPTNANLGDITRYTIVIKRNDSTPEITSITPENSYAGGGIFVSITGSNFASGATVTFNGVQAESKVLSNVRITCIVPPYDGVLTQNADVTVTVTNPGGNSDVTTFTYIAMTAIGGNVTSGAAEITNCVIQVSSADSSFYTTTTTDENGVYTVSGLKLYDKYIVSAWPDKEIACYKSEYYDDKDINTADHVSTMNGSRFDIDFSLEACANGQISGSITDGDGNPLTTSILVKAFSKALNESSFTDKIKPDGSYVITGLKSANDYIVSVDWTEKPEVSFYYDGVVDIQDATPIPVDNNHVPNINLKVDASFTGSVSGVVSDCSGNPVADIPIFAKSSGLNVQQFVLTDAKGHYEFSDLPRVEDEDRLSKGYIISAKKRNYPTRYYQNTSNVNEASRVITGEVNINITGIGCGHTISGKITDESGRPVYNVPVLVKSLSSDDQKSSGIVYSNIRGDYTITLMPLNDYVVRAAPVDYQLQYYNNAKTLSEATLVDIFTGNQTGIDFVLTKGPKLCGQIMINDSAAWEGVPVNIWSESTQTGGTVLTDSNGLYEITGLDSDAADYIISVILSGYLPSFYHPDGTKYSWTEAGKASPSATCDKNINIKDGFAIFGRVSYNGNPVYNVEVEAFASNTNGWGMDVTHRIQGSENNFVIKGLKPGNYEITVNVKQDCYSADPISIEIDNQDVNTEIELLNTCASMYGTINNLPSDKTVFVSVLSQSTLNYKNVPVSNNSQTIANVSYTITNLKPADDYIVKMTSWEFPTQYYQNQTNWSDADYVDLSTGDQTNIDFTIVTPKTITGKITFINAEAGDIAIVMAESRELNANEYATITYPDTEYTLTVKPASDYVVSIRSFKFSATPEEQIVDATSNQTGIDFTLDAGAEISGHISDENGKNVSGIPVEAWSDSILEWSVAITDNSGNYTIKGLKQAADYIIYVDHPIKSCFYYGADGTVKDKSNASKINVTHGNVSDIDIQFFTVESISGKVMDENGRGLSNVWVYAWSDTEQSGNGARTESDGSFTIPGLAPSVDYEVEAIPYGTSLYRSAIRSNIASGETDLIFILSEGFILDGTITNMDGDPVSKVIVEIRSFARDFYRRTRTNAQGAYEIKGIVPSQDYKLMTTATGDDSYIPVKEDIAIVNDTTRDIELILAYQLDGYVRKDGTGIKNVLVTILSLSNNYFDSEKLTAEDITHLKMYLQDQIIR
ncbi:MAG: hypothetical protein OMM_02712 [Candidatus Magnetoglobus multicellularis str. Araruama]|uniref:IPT/TIG domain-containing protein n=1 Tax=Candidatus Magnetoglobus multicellularis str. Araruama TaxID=890399 RepID=A0A1V1P8Q9_9BACT|nr:MAG: hypothetical protein OMM_02712 [Candidatus Magnetoglobus multicellularis str. Araruama]